MIVEKIAAENYVVDAVETANECFELAKNKTYDIILIDLNLDDPGIDGFGVLDKLKTYPSTENSIFIAHTNYFGNEWGNKCIEAGFDYYYPKPFDLQTFQELLKS
jgi:CheY-like chemotaxis protein